MSVMSASDIQKFWHFDFPLSGSVDQHIFEATVVHELQMSVRWSVVGTWSGNKIKTWGTNDADTVLGGQGWTPIAADEVVGDAAITSGVVALNSGSEGNAQIFWRKRLPKWIKFEFQNGTHTDGTFDACIFWR